MENASKALLIAGSILITILLIAVGLKIFNSTAGTTEATKTTMDATAVSVFNSQFIPYVGKNKTRAEAIALANKIVASNAVNKEHQVIFVVKNSASSAVGTYNLTSSAVIGYLNDKPQYNITFTSYSTTGYITTITFTASDF